MAPRRPLRGIRGPGPGIGSGHDIRGTARAQRPGRRGRGWRAALAAPALVGALAALVAHLPSLSYGFVRDDLPLIVENALLRAPGGLGRLLTGDFLASIGYSSGLWRPMVLLTFWLEGRLGGWSPALFHAGNVLLHAGATAVVGMLLVQAALPRGAALAGALWFALMPAHLEPVAWISGRTDLLCATFALLALWLDRRARAAGRAWAGAGALAAMAAALLSKEAAAGWVLVLAAAERARARHHAISLRAQLLWLAPYLALTVLWLGAHAWAAGPSALPGYLDPAREGLRRAAAATMLPQFVGFLWPWYPHASDVATWLPPAPFAWPVLAGGALSVAALGAAGWLLLRGSALAVPCAILLVPLLPSLAVALGRAYLTSGERLMYLPSAGAVWLAALGLGAAIRRAPAARRMATGLAVAVVAGSALETLRLQPMWRDNETVFRAVTERHPGNPTGWVGLAGVLTGADRRAEAEAALARAEGLDPRLPAVHSARAELHYRSGEWEEVLAAAGRALALDPDLFEARLLRASTLVRLRRPAEAAKDLERLLRARPQDPSALMVEGQRLLAEERPAEAREPLERAARARPDDPGLWYGLGVARAAAGDLGAARGALERSLALEPGSVAGWRRLATVCAAMGDTVAAGAAHARAVALGGRRGP